MSANDVANQLRAAAGNPIANQEALARLFADEIQLRHEPPHPSDGPIPGRLLAEMARRELAAVARALPDAEQDSEITVEGDGVRMRGRTRGTLADGTAVDVQTNTLFSVADGRIVGLRSDMDARSMESWGVVLAAGAIEVPPEFLERLSAQTS
jgi:ketosteroid isomerase-like protein